ncbi:DUF6585 family protein [Streptomyces sp. NPDC091273]|uniref:DUF6585 family protein n=1 Tax=Streptomyces sp. NPDC091273 TaxID=3365982 RepID=UPI00380F8B7F
MARAVGIDLGTTHSAVAVFEGGRDRPVVTTVPNAEGSRTTPSVVAFTAEGEVLVGEAAARQAVTNPARTVHGVKRLLGTDWTLPIDGTTYSAQRIAALLLGRLRRDAEAWVGEPVTEAVITVPADFGEARRQAVREAGELAGLTVLRLISEPGAVGLAYGTDRDADEETVLVCRLGGGSFDVGVLELGWAGNTFVVDVGATAGDHLLGGEDWDRAVADWLATRFHAAHGVDLTRDDTAVRRLREAAERAKTDLSSSARTTVGVPFVAASDHGPLHLDEQLTREDLERLTGSLRERCAPLLRRVMEDAYVSPGEITRIVLSGGGTRMPALADLVREELAEGPQERTTVRVEEACVRGAALQAAVLTGAHQGLLLLDATHAALGVETAGGVMTPVVVRGTTIPTQRSMEFTTDADLPEGGTLAFRVYRGDDDAVAGCEHLGTVELTGLPHRGRGAPRIEVTFDIGGDGSVEVVARDAAGARTGRMAPGRTGAPPPGPALVPLDPKDAAKGPGAAGAPPPARLAAEQEGLGGHTTGYASAGSRAWEGLAGAAGVCAALVPLGALLAQPVLAVLGAVAAASLGVPALLTHAARGKYARLDLFERGVVVSDADGRTAACRWDSLQVRRHSVARYLDGVYYGTEHYCTLSRPDGSVLLPGTKFPFAQSWGPVVEEAAARAQLPGALATIRAGGSVVFGPFSLSREAVTADGRPEPWDRIEPVSYGNGTASLRVMGRQQPLGTVSVGLVNGFPVFLTLVDHLRAGRR